MCFFFMVYSCTQLATKQRKNAASTTELQPIFEVKTVTRSSLFSPPPPSTRGFQPFRNYKVTRARAPAPRAWPERCARCTRTCPRPRWPPGVREEAGPGWAHRSACLNAASWRSLWSSPPRYRSAGCPGPCVPGRWPSPCGKAWRGSWGWTAGTGSGRTWSLGPGGRSGCPWGRGSSHTDCRTHTHTHTVWYYHGNDTDCYKDTILSAV